MVYLVLNLPRMEKKILDKIKLGDVITFWGRQRQGYRKKV